MKDKKEHDELKEYFDSIQEYRAQFRVLLLNSLKEGLTKVKEVSDSNKYIGKYYDWPQLSFKENGLPTLSKSFQEPIHYRDCFANWRGKPLINEDEIVSFKDFLNFVQERPRLEERFLSQAQKNIFFDENKIAYSIFITSTIKEAIERYVHIYNSFEFDEKKATHIVIPFENYIFNETLKIDIIVPILFLSFEFDTFIIDDGVEIQRINEKIHLARYNIKSYNATVNDSVLSSATHALILKDWFVENPKCGFNFNALTNPQAYPSDRIEKFFGAIRIVTDKHTGYAQLMAIAKNWIRYVKADLPYIAGVSVRSYPTWFENYYWNIESIPKIANSEMDSIKSIYIKLLNTKENSINISLKRLNRCVVRDNEEDSVLDATIALEALVSDEGNHEMTHKLAMRIAAISKLSDYSNGNPLQVFNDIKKIYDYRSAIVHGSKKLEKKRYIKIDENKKVTANLLAVNYLRLVLKLLLEKPEYRDPKKIDDYLLTEK